MIPYALLPNGAQPSIGFIRSQYAYLQTIFAGRNATYRTLREHFDGETPDQQKAGLLTGTPFKNYMDLAYNLNNASIRKYCDRMSAPPRFDARPEGFELDDIELADKRTKFLEYVWSCNNITKLLMQAGWCQALLDRAIFFPRPKPENECGIGIELAVPDFYYPLCTGDDWNNPRAIIYGFRCVEQPADIRDPQKFSATDIDISENIIYMDPWWYVEISKRGVTTIPHGFGCHTFVEAPNLPVPFRYRGQGDIDQTIGLQDHLNMLMSAMGQMIAYAAAPIAVVRGTKVGGTNLPFTPGAVWELERDAQAQFLQWSGTPPTVEAQILRVIQGIEDQTGVNTTAFGREIPSGTSGNALRALGAGYDSRLGAKQQLMGDAISRVNEHVQLIAEKVYPNREYRIPGENVAIGRKMGQRRMYTVKPSEFKGWYKNDVIFTPLDPASTYFQETDKMKLGLQSKITTMKRIGIQNPYDEIERMQLERQMDAEHENNLGLAKNGQLPSPGGEEDLANVFHQVFGKQATPEQKAQEKKVETAVSKQSSTGTNELSSGSSPLGDQPDPNQEPIDVNDALSRLRQAQNLSGRAALLGEQIILENPADENAVRAALGPTAKRFKFGRLDPTKPLPTGAVSFSSAGSQKKNQVEARETPGLYLRVIVLDREFTNTQAPVYSVGVLDDRGSVVPVGKTQPQRKVKADPDEIISVEVKGLSRRGDDKGGWKYALVMAMPVRSPMTPAHPSKLRDLERNFK